MTRAHAAGPRNARQAVDVFGDSGRRAGSD